MKGREESVPLPTWLVTHFFSAACAAASRAVGTR